MPNPCYDHINHKDCPRRRPGCAVDCLDWLLYVEKRDEEYLKRQSEVDTDSYIIDHATKIQHRKNKWGGKPE